MDKIKNIIFDLGGVLLDLDYNKTIAAFRQLGIEHFEKMYSQLTADKLFQHLETGHITESEFHEAIKKCIPHAVSKEKIDAAWNSLILHFPKEKIDFLERISKTYKIFLLSNTNAIHLKHFQQVFIEDTGRGSLESLFSKVWYSHLLGLRKPGREIYEFVLEDADLVAGETFFIDDTTPNIETARQLGIRSHLLLPGQRLDELGL